MNASEISGAGKLCRSIPPTKIPKGADVHHFKHNFTLKEGTKKLPVKALSTYHGEYLSKGRRVIDADSCKHIGYAVSTEPSVVTLFNLAGQRVLEIAGLPSGYEKAAYTDKKGRKVILDANPSGGKVNDPFNKGKAMYRIEWTPQKGDFSIGNVYK